jgi:virginiamycin B lyase
MPDGALWFVAAKEIGQITTSGTVTGYSCATNIPWTITTGADGALWFTENTGSKIGRITVLAATSSTSRHNADDNSTGNSARNRWFADSPLEENGFEPSVPRVTIKGPRGSHVGAA